MPAAKPIPIGTRFFRLITISDVFSVPKKRRRVLCRCDCGEVIEVTTNGLQSGNTKSCGCLRTDTIVKISTKHGGASRKRPNSTFRGWCGMIERCTNVNHVRWKSYGGRGISVCERWRNYAAFMEDMGDRPEGHSLDRIDNDGNYEPSNCRWATSSQQARNRRSTRFLTFQGETLCVSDWAELFGVTIRLICKRLLLGWSVEQALTKPARKMSTFKTRT